MANLLQIAKKYGVSGFDERGQFLLPDGTLIASPELLPHTALAHLIVRQADPSHGELPNEDPTTDEYYNHMSNDETILMNHGIAKITFTNEVGASVGLTPAQLKALKEYDIDHPIQNIYGLSSKDDSAVRRALRLAAREASEQI